MPVIRYNYPKSAELPGRILFDSEAYDGVCLEIIDRHVVIYTRYNGILALPVNSGLVKFGEELGEIFKVWDGIT